MGRHVKGGSRKGGPDPQLNMEFHVKIGQGWIVLNGIFLTHKFSLCFKVRLEGPFTQSKHLVAVIVNHLFASARFAVQLYLRVIDAVDRPVSW